MGSAGFCPSTVYIYIYCILYTRIKFIQGPLSENKTRLEPLILWNSRARKKLPAYQRLNSHPCCSSEVTKEHLRPQGGEGQRFWAVNPRKLEHRFRMIHAGISLTLRA